MTAEGLDFAASLFEVARRGDLEGLARRLAEHADAAVEIDAGARRIRVGHAPANGHEQRLPLLHDGFSLGELRMRSHAPADRCAGEFRLIAAAAVAVLAEERPGRSRSFWEELLANGFPDAAAAREAAAARNLALAISSLCCILESDPNDESGISFADLHTLAAHAFSGLGGKPVFVPSEDGYTIILPTEREIDRSNAKRAAVSLARALTKRFPQRRFWGGIGPSTATWMLPHSLHGARVAALVGRRIFGLGHIAAYDDIGAYPLLYDGAGREELRAFATRTLAPIRSYDEKHQTELERTLRCYFDAGQNVKTTAERLFVHRHTVLYRLRQIAELCKATLDAPHDQLHWRMALAIEALHHE